MRKVAFMASLVALSAISVMPVAAKQGAPGAPPPDVFKGTKVPTVYTDDVLCQYAPYNFDVEVEGTDTYTMTVYYNPDSTPSKITWVDNFQGTVTANGVTLRKHSAGNTIYDYNAGIDTFKGLAAKYQPINATITRAFMISPMSDSSATIRNTSPPGTRPGPARYSCIE